MFRLPRITGKVIDTKGIPIQNAFVRIYMQESNQLTGLLLTDENGEFKAFVPKDIYQIAISKQNYIWVESGKVQTLYSCDARQLRQHVVAAMQDAEDIYSMFFEK